MTWTLDEILSLRLEGVDPADDTIIRDLCRVWATRRPRNLKRSLYYDAEQAFKDLGIALPPQLKRANHVLGWATQAVRKPAMRSQFEGLRLPGSDDPFELSETFSQNNFDLGFSQAILGAYTHGVSLVTVTPGESALGEPGVLIHSHSADESSMLWDGSHRRLAAAMTVNSLGEGSRPERFTVLLPHALYAFRREYGRWTTEKWHNRTGRVLAVPVLNDPQSRRPLGRSRITLPVMELCDAGVRTFVRMESNSEFYSSPQVALLGLDAEAFGGSMSDNEKFKLAMDRLIALTKDVDGDKPTLQQLTQASMTPHSDMLRTIASAFSGETSIPVSSLGIIHDQPASAEAIRAAEHDLLVDATYHNKHVHPVSVREIATLAVMVRDNMAAPPDEAWRLTARFADPEFRSMSANADGVQKLAASMPDIAKWDVLLESAFDEAQVERIKEQAAAMASAPEPAPPVPVTALPDESPAI